MSTQAKTKIQVANAPCSWGVLEFELKGQPHGYRRVLDEMAQSGYSGTELGDWGFMPTDSSELKSELSKRNLEMLAAFVPIAFADEGAWTDGLERAVKVATLLAAVSLRPFVVLSDDNCKNPTRQAHAGRIKPEQGMTDGQWRTFLTGVEKIARGILDNTGVRSVFHHHCAGFIETPAEIDRFINGTDPELVGLCLDTGHYAYGGGDPLQAFVKYGSRINHVHFKDCDPAVAEKARKNNWNYFEAVNGGIFCELGKGAVPFKDIVAQLRKQSYDGWIVVEQDVLPGTGTPLESNTRNREFLRSLGL